MDFARLIICPQCSASLKNPLVLPCHHSLCRDCILKLLNNQTHLLRCPQCASSHQVLNVDLLPQNTEISQIVMQLQQISEDRPPVQQNCRTSNQQLISLQQVLFANLSELKTSKETVEAEVTKYFGQLEAKIAQARDRVLSQLEMDYNLKSQQIQQQIDSNQEVLRGSGGCQFMTSALHLDCYYDVAVNQQLEVWIANSLRYSRGLHVPNAVKAIRILGLNQEGANVQRSRVLRRLHCQPAGIQLEHMLYPLSKSGTAINQLSSNMSIQVFKSPAANRAHPQSQILSQTKDQTPEGYVGDGYVPTDLLQMVFPTKFLHKEVCLQAVQGNGFLDLPLENTAGVEEMLGASARAFDFAVQSCQSVNVGLRKCSIQIAENTARGACQDCGVDVVVRFNAYLKTVNKLIKRAAGLAEQKAQFLARCKGEFQQEADRLIQRLQNLQQQYIQQKQQILVTAATISTLANALAKALQDAAADPANVAKFRAQESRIQQDLAKARKQQQEFEQFENYVNCEVQAVLGDVTQLEARRVNCFDDVLSEQEVIAELASLVQLKRPEVVSLRVSLDLSTSKRQEAGLDAAEGVASARCDISLMQQQFRMLYNALLTEPVDALLPPVIESANSDLVDGAAKLRRADEHVAFTQQMQPLQRPPQGACGLAVAEFDFAAENENEVCLRQAQRYWVFEISEWAVVAPFETPNVRGVAPWSHLKPINCQSMYAWTQELGVEFGGILVTKKCEFDFIGEEEGEIDLKEGDVVEGFKVVCDGWAWGKNRRTGEEGRFPKDYVV